MEKQFGAPGGGGAENLGGIAELGPSTLSYQISGGISGAGEVALASSPVSLAGAKAIIRKSAVRTINEISKGTDLGAGPVEVAEPLAAAFAEQSQANFAARAKQAEKIEQAATDDASTATAQEEPATAVEVTPAEVEVSPAESEAIELSASRIEDYLGQIASFLAEQPVTVSPDVDTTDNDAALATAETSDIEPAPKPAVEALTDQEFVELLGAITLHLAEQESTLIPESDVELSAKSTDAAKANEPDSHLYELLSPDIVVS